MVKTLGAITAILLSMSACSSSSPDLSADEQKAADSLSQSFQAQQNPKTGFTADRGQADCIAESLVAQIGTDSLVTYGFLTPNLTADTSSARNNIPADDAGTMADIFMGCANIAQLIKDDLGYDQMPAAVQGCVDDALSDETVRDVLVSSFTGDGSAAQDLQTTITACTMAG